VLQTIRISQMLLVAHAFAIAMKARGGITKVGIATSIQNTSST